jgi:hypothetical protein
MTFEEWRKTELLDDEYFHRNDMYWYAELAWNAAVRTMVDQEMKTKNNQSVQPTEKSVGG